MCLIVRKITRAPSGYGAFSFLSKMLRRDWNFRQQAYPYIAMGLLAISVVVIIGVRNSPFGEAGVPIVSFSPIHMLPHCLGLILAIACVLISFTSEPQGASIFITLPLKSLRPFVKGVYISLWLYIVGLPHLFLLGLCMWFWGAFHGMLFIAFSTSLVSLYLGLACFFIEGFAYANPFKPSKVAAMNIPIIIFMMMAAMFVVLQWFLFRNPMVVLGATAVLAALHSVCATRCHAELVTVGLWCERLG